MNSYISTADYNVPASRPDQCFTTAPDLLHADVVFGSPREDCAGTGICRIEALGDFPTAAASRDCRRARATLSAPDDHTLVLDFQRSDLCSQLFRHYFRHDVFDLPQGCTLPAALAQQLRLAQDTLVPGNYPIRPTATGFQISLIV